MKLVGLKRSFNSEEKEGGDYLNYEAPLPLCIQSYNDLPLRFLLLLSQTHHLL